MSKTFVSDITMNTLTPEVPEAPEVGMDPYFKSVWMNEACKHAMRPNSAVDHVKASQNLPLFTCNFKTIKPKFQLNKTLEKRLAFHLRAHLGQKKTKNVGRQAIFSILGYSFVRTYLPDEIFDISCLEPSDITSAQKETALSLARTQLKELVDKTCQDVGLDLMGANPSRFSGSDAIQLEVDAVWNEAVEKYMRTGKKLKVKKDVKGKKVKKGMKLDDGALVHWTNVEDIAGQAVAELCACDPTLLQQLKDTFIKKNYSLPSSLRLFIIQNYLFSKGDIQVRRESFKDTVSRNSKEMKLERATRCRIWQTIDSAIIEVYGRVPTLKLYDSDAHDAEAAHILNVLHVYNKTYDPTLIIWLFPLQMIVTKAIKDEGYFQNFSQITILCVGKTIILTVIICSDAVVVDLAMYLDTMSRSCVASARDVTDLADTVVDTWQQWDKELLSPE